MNEGNHVTRRRATFSQTKAVSFQSLQQTDVSKQEPDLFHNSNIDVSDHKRKNSKVLDYKITNYRNLLNDTQ